MKRIGRGSIGARGRWAAALTVLLLAGLSCAEPRRKAPPPPERPPKLLQDVPDVLQSTDYSCGCAALAAVLVYYGVEADEALVLREAKVDPEAGIELEEIARVARRHGVRGLMRERLTLEEVAKELAAGRPVLVLNQSWKEDPRRTWKEDWEDGHYLVVLGLDDGYVYVEDPSLEGARGYIPRAEFLERWHGWTIDERKMQGQGMFFRGKRKPPRAPLQPVEELEYVE